MPNRTAKFASAIFACMFACTALTTISHGATVAADDCLSGPKGQTPAGGHWYYRVERITKRHCWYLGEERDKLSQAARPNTSASAKPLPPEADTAVQQSVANARAELPAQTYRNEPPNPVLPANAAGSEDTVRANAPDANASLSVVASRWPEPSGVEASVANRGPDNPAGNTPTNAIAAPPPVVAAATLAAADSSSQSRPGSVPMLMAAVAGALALAGITAGLIFKFGRAPHSRSDRIRARRGPIWESTDDDSIALPDRRGAHVFPHTAQIFRGFGEASDPSDRIAEFYARISGRAPT
jgi:hypothetical protein